MIDISIVIPVYNEENYIIRCLESIKNADFNSLNYEVLIVDGGSTDNSLKIINEFITNNQNFKVLTNKIKTTPSSLNLALKYTTGRYICRLDAHSSFPYDYFTKLYIIAEKFGSDNVGGVAITSTISTSYFAKSICTALSSIVSVGNSDFRLGVDNIKEVDTVPFGFFRKNVFEKFGTFNENLIRNQDIEFNKRIKRGGGLILLSPDVNFTYYCRTNVIDFLSNQFDNGFWNIRTCYLTKSFSSLALRHFVPLIFVMSLLISAFFSFKISLFLSIFHFLVILISYYSFPCKLNVGPAIVTVLMHYSYGIGSFCSLFKFK